MISTDSNLRLGADFRVKDVVPKSANLFASPPEVLWSQIQLSQLQTPTSRVVGVLPISGATADIWSAGSVLYSMLTGAPPFEPANEKESDQLIRRIGNVGVRNKLFQHMLATHESWVCINLLACTCASMQLCKHEQMCMHV